MDYSFVYRTHGTCSRNISITVDGDTVKDVCFDGGCSGNSQGVAALCRGKNIDEVINTLKGIKCGFKPTSCPDQLARALEEYKENI